MCGLNDALNFVWIVLQWCAIDSVKDIRPWKKLLRYWFTTIIFSGRREQRSRLGVRQLVGGAKEGVGSDLADHVGREVDGRCQGRRRDQGLWRRPTWEDSDWRKPFYLQGTLVREPFGLAKWWRPELASLYELPYDWWQVRFQSPLTPSLTKAVANRRPIANRTLSSCYERELLFGLRRRRSE